MPKVRNPFHHDSPNPNYPPKSKLLTLIVHYGGRLKSTPFDKYVGGGMMKFDYSEVKDINLKLLNIYADNMNAKGERKFYFVREGWFKVIKDNKILKRALNEALPTREFNLYCDFEIDPPFPEMPELPVDAELQTNEGNAVTGTAQKVSGNENGGCEVVEGDEVAGEVDVVETADKSRDVSSEMEINGKDQNEGQNEGEVVSDKGQNEGEATDKCQNDGETSDKGQHEGEVSNKRKVVITELVDSDSSDDTYEEESEYTDDTDFYENVDEDVEGEDIVSPGVVSLPINDKGKSIIVEVSDYESDGNDDTYEEESCDK